MLNNKIERIVRLDKSRVYKIKCEDCDHVYIVQTRRSFKPSCKEHLDSKRPSQVADHMLDNNDHTNINNIKILHFANKGKKLDTR